MEEQGKNSELIKMYKKRLDNLEQVIQNLHQQVGNDEVLEGLPGQQLVKYRIDRVHELVQEILESEKQQMLIKVLEKYEQMSSRSKQSTSNRSSVEVERKNEEIQQLKNLIYNQENQIKLKDRQIEQFKSQLNTKRSELAKITSAVKQSCKQCQNKLQEKRQLQKQLQNSFKLVSKLKKDGKEAVEQLQRRNQQLGAEMAHKDKKHGEQLRKYEEEIKAITEKSETAGKMETMQKQVTVLEDDLMVIVRNFNIIKECALEETVKKLKKLRNSYQKFRNTVKGELEDYQNTFTNSLKQQLPAMIKRALKMKQIGEKAEPVPEKIIKKVNQIDNELDYFIQNQLIV